MNTLIKKQETATATATQTFADYICNETTQNKLLKYFTKQEERNFSRELMQIVAQNSQLAACDHATIISAALQCKQLSLSLSPHLGQVFIVPYMDKRGPVAIMQIGYLGYYQLALRSGQYKKITSVEIKEGEIEEFDYVREKIILKSNKNFENRESLQTIGYYACFLLKNGFEKEVYWTKQQMEAHATKYSTAYRARRGFSFWEKDFDAMGKKTMIRTLIRKWGAFPSPDISNALKYDMAMIHPETQDPEYVDNIQQE